MPTRPKEVDQIIKKYTKAKVPYFFQYAKGKTKEQCEIPNNSPMNRFSNKFKMPRMMYLRRMAKVNYRLMLSNVDFELCSESYKVLEVYDYWNKHQKFLYNTIDENHAKQEDLFMYQEIRKKILEETSQEIDFVVNSLVTLYYTTRNFSQKKMLWACFGDVIVKNLKSNTQNLGEVCPICGRRFHKMGRQLTCSKDCGHKLDILNKRLKRSGDVLVGAVN